jgi:hypothetical protein
MPDANTRTSMSRLRRPSPPRIIIAFAISTLPFAASASDALNILKFASVGQTVDRTGREDASAALAGAISAANVFTAKGEPACVYIPPGVYRIVTPPPTFVRAGCVRGDGPTQSILRIDPSFEGDVFAWSEAWAATTPGPVVVGLKITGDPSSKKVQNALVFYDRNDDVFLDNVEVDGLHGRALYSGVKKYVSQAYMRESHLRSLRFFYDGAPGVPVVEFSSEGSGATDATNEVELAQVDIFGPASSGFVIRNNGSSRVRDIIAEGLRIEGWQNGKSTGDLITIGDPHMPGNVNNIRLTDLELIDPQSGFAALRLTAAPQGMAPYHITVQGTIGGGAPFGQGLRIDAGRSSVFRLSGLYSWGTNIVVGRGVSGVVLDGGGQERDWTFKVDPTSAHGICFPVQMMAAGPNLRLTPDVTH